VVGDALRVEGVAAAAREVRFHRRGRRPARL
jgi:hypothetical protein